MTKEIEIVEIGVAEGVDLGYGIKDYLLPDVVLYRGEGTLFIVQFCVSGQHQ